MRLNELRQVNIDNMDKTELVDLKTVKVDDSAPVADRLQQYLSQVNNPYAFRVGDIAVKIEFSKSGTAAIDVLKTYLSGLRDSK